MAQFPILKTGAVAQYPAKLTFLYRADIVPFLDGSEQRYRNSPSVLHQWEIDLAQLDEQEIANIQQFFLQNQGGADNFAFTDPWSNAVYSNCSIAGDDLGMTYKGLLSGSTTVILRENRVS